MARGAALTLLGLDGRVKEESPLPAVFANHEQGIDIQIEGVNAISASLHGASFQVAGELARPLLRDIDLRDGLTFSDGFPQRMHVSIKIPNVAQQAEILYRLSIFPNRSSTNAISVGDLRFQVFPASLTRELTDLLQPKPGSASSVVLFGSGQRLRHLFSGWRLTFREGGTDLPDRFDPSLIYFGELDTPEEFQLAADRSAGARMVIFSPDDTLPAGIYSDRSSAGYLVHVNSRLLENLKSDPRAQMAFIKILHLISTPLTNPN
jgi:hypothetical protein